MQKYKNFQLSTAFTSVTKLVTNFPIVCFKSLTEECFNDCNRSQFVTSFTSVVFISFAIILLIYFSNFNKSNCFIISSSNFLDSSNFSFKEALWAARLALNSSSVISTYSIFTSKYWPAESE